MTDERPSSETSLTETAASAPRKATDVLCREVGATHPDGALRQIRTMKRLLRSHYRVKQRLERYGVESLSDAVVRIAELSRQVREYKEQERERAQDRLEVLDDLMGAVEAVQQRLNARPETTADDAPPSSSGETPLHDAERLIDALEEALDEMRLELWLHQSRDEEEPDTPVAATAAQLLDRLADKVDAAAETHDELEAKTERLADRNDTLQREVSRLQQTVQQQQERIEELEQKLGTAP